MVVNIFLFDDFEIMDAFAPAELFGKMPERFYIRYLSRHGGLINSAQGVKVWTEPLNPVEIEDILIIPGGKGVKRLFYLNQEIFPVLKKAVENADYCMSVAQGTALLIQTGVLYHRNVADYAYDENWKRMFLAGTNMVSGMKWVADGKFYSCSGTMKCIDMVLSMIADCTDLEIAKKIADQLEIDWDEAEEDIIR